MTRLLLPILSLSFVFGCTNKSEKVSLNEVTETAQQAPAEVPSQADTGVSEQTAEQGMTSPATAEGDVSGGASSASPTAAAQPVGSRILGSVTASKVSNVSFKQAGHISKMLYNAGARVKAGQVIASLDDTDHKLRARIAEAALSQAKNNLEQLKRDFAREERLKRENASTQIAFEKTETALANAQLAVTQAQLSYEQAAKADSDTKLKAPFDGIISKQFRNQGEHVGVGAPVYEMYDAEIEIALKVPEALMDQVKLGQELELSVPSVGANTTMKITRIVPIISESSRTFDVVGKSKDSKLMPGQFVEAQL